MPKTLNGRIYWLEQGGPYVVRDAIVLDDRISFDVTQGDRAYSVTLTPAPGSPSMWGGPWRCANPREVGHVDARLYTAVDSGVVLIGNWKEVGDDVWWFMELRP